MRNLILTLLVLLPGAAALAQTTDNAAAARETKEVELPPGFKVKKRGDITLYCIKGKATGTRFQTETCYDETQLHDYLLAREQNNRDFDRARAICSNPAICAPQ